MKNHNICSVHGCNNPTRRNTGTMCNRHEIQMRRHGRITDAIITDLPGERWKNVDGYSGNYLVSNHGRVKSMHRETPIILKPCIEKKTGRLRVSLGENNAVFLDLLVLTAFKPNPDNDHRPFFKDGDKLNVKAENLEWMTSHKIKTSINSLSALSDTNRDANAILNYMKGDGLALSGVLINARPIILGYARYKISSMGLTYIDAEDIAHEALVVAMKAMKQGQVSKVDKLTEWFKAIAKSVLLNQIKDMSRYIQTDDELQNGFMDHAIYHELTDAAYA